MIKISKLCLYSNKGESRELLFSNSGLNIITGASKRGKSSILDIVEYCLGASDCNIAHGHIRKNVKWYSVVVSDGLNEYFIARQNPEKNSKVSNEFHITPIKKSQLPHFDALIKNANNLDAINFLTKLCRMELGKTEVPSGQTRSSINIDFKNSLYLYFQNQDEIANKKMIFHRQSEPFLPQMIVDTIPYFIGATSSSRIYDKDTLRNLKRKYKLSFNKYMELKNIRNEGTSNAYSLLSDAKAVQIYDGETSPSSTLNLINALDEISKWSPTNDAEFTISGDENFKIEIQYNELLNEKRIINDKINSLESFNHIASNYDSSKEEQLIRLKTIDLFEKIDKNNTFDSELKEILKRNAFELKSELEDSHRNRPNLLSNIALLKEKQFELSKKIKEKRNYIKSLMKINIERDESQSKFFVAAKISGKAELYLNSMNNDDQLKELNTTLNNLEDQISEIENDLSHSAMEEKLSSQLSLINSDITRWARELKLEHSEYPIRLDLKKLTICADTPNGTIPLYQMGSGENWVGYHLVTHIALAKWFSEQNRPVGRFIFLDQPSQVYFPAEKSTNGNINEILNDEDRLAVKRMFKWLHDVSKNDLKEKVQIIITDHADIDEPWFQEAICDNKWRGDEYLIPKSWYDEKVK